MYRVQPNKCTVIQNLTAGNEDLWKWCIPLYDELRQQTCLTRIVFPPIGAWIHDGHCIIRWVECRLRTELQNRPVNSLEGSMSVQAKYCGSDRRWYMYIRMRSSSGLFQVQKICKMLKTSM